VREILELTNDWNEQVVFDVQFDKGKFNDICDGNGGELCRVYEVQHDPGLGGHPLVKVLDKETVAEQTPEVSWGRDALSGDPMVAEFWGSRRQEIADAGHRVLGDGDLEETGAG